MRWGGVRWGGGGVGAGWRGVGGVERVSECEFVDLLRGVSRLPQDVCSEPRLTDLSRYQSFMSFALFTPLPPQTNK